MLGAPRGGKVERECASLGVMGGNVELGLGGGSLAGTSVGGAVGRLGRSGC